MVAEGIFQLFRLRCDNYVRYNLIRRFNKNRQLVAKPYMICTSSKKRSKNKNGSNVPSFSIFIKWDFWGKRQLYHKMPALICDSN